MDLLSDIWDKPKIAPRRYRIYAAIIDFIILVLAGAVLGYFYGQHYSTGSMIGVRLDGWPAFAFYAFGFCIIPIQEGLTGKTIGQRLLKIRVIKIESAQESVGASITRHLFDAVDLFFLAGLIVSSYNEKRQRIGDLVAGTIVVADT